MEISFGYMNVGIKCVILKQWDIHVCCLCFKIYKVNNSTSKYFSLTSNYMSMWYHVAMCNMKCLEQGF